MLQHGINDFLSALQILIWEDKLPRRLVVPIFKEMLKKSVRNSQARELALLPSFPLPECQFARYRPGPWVADREKRIEECQ
jgi:hypothetical protein